jgi:Uma2 family endonuclease
LQAPAIGRPHFGSRDVTGEVSRTSDSPCGERLRRRGVPEYWLVNPSAASIEVYELAGSAYVLRQAAGRLDAVRSATLSELEFPASRAFPD